MPTPSNMGAEPIVLAYSGGLDTSFLVPWLVEHHQIDARADYFEQVLRFLIMGNVRRGQLYPLCVGAERVMQAQTLAHIARKLGTRTIAHGCTAAGNDQVRFEVALRTLAPELEVIAPVRDKAFKRQDELEYLQKRGLPLPP